MSLAFTAVFAGCLLADNLAQAGDPTLQLRIPFTQTQGSGTTTPSDTSGGGINISLTMETNISASTGVIRDLNGNANSGVNGSATGIAAMDFTTNFNKVQGLVQPASGNGDIAVDLNDATLASGLGNNGLITNFVVTMWFKQPAQMSGNTGPRMWILNAGAAGVDSGANANTIGLKWQGNNQIYLQIGADTVTIGPAQANPFPTNQWLFIAVTYDGTNATMYYGADNAVAQSLGAGSSLNRSVNLGSAACLSIGNRVTGARGFNGWINDFRFYSGGVPTNMLTFVENIRRLIAPPLPAITGVYPDGTALMQATNKLVFTAISTGANNFTNISLFLNTVNVSASLQFVTNGTAGTATNVTASYTGLLPQTVYTAVITAANSIGLKGTVTVNFDTFNPTNFIVKAEEFDFNSGQFIDNPVYTNTADPNSYFGLDSVEGVDTHKGQTTGDNQATDYRFDDGTGTDTQTPLAAGELPSPTRFGGNIPSHMIGNWSSAEWQNYTKTFPAGLYNVYARLTTSSGSTVTFDQVISGQGTPRASQTLANLGQFTYSGSGAFQWVPLLKNGTLAVVNLSGQNTVSTTTGGGANADFYMLVPANPNLPSISNVYPDGQFLFEPTNKLVFTVSSSAGINTANITLTLNGTNFSAGLVFSGGPNTWNVSYTGLQNNQTYATVISVIDGNAASANATLSIDTWNPVLQVEAEDFDFNPAKSIVPDATGFRYIDNPVPTPPLVAAANSYEGQVGDTFLDEQGNNLNNGQSPIQNAYAGATMSNYRTNDPCATAPITDTARRQFQGTGALDYNVGFLGAGHWEQYTRTWPSGTYNLYARVASGANLGTLYSSWSQVITGWGTTNQTTRHIGSFAIPSTGGYSSYFYTPLIDAFGNYAQLTGGTNTFRDTHLVFNQTETANTAVYGLNINFYMLVAARTDLARIDNVYPDGVNTMQVTNTLSFVASSPTYGINTTNIHVTLNGVNISSNLVFSGSSGSWNVSYPGLQPGSTYTAVITVTDNNNQSHTTTVNFDTFNPNNFTWEAEDFDFGPENSPDPNGSTNRYIDNPAPTHSAATNSYFGQVSDLGIDVDTIFGNTHFGTYLYRSGDWVATEVTSDGLRSKYVAARQLDPTIVDYDVYLWTNNAFINYTRTYPAGNYHVFARASGGLGAFQIQCGQVTNGWGTTTQSNQYLGTFSGTGANFNTWQYVPLVNTNTGLPVSLSLGGTNTFQMAADGLEHVNFFMLEAANPVTLTASISGANIVLSIPTQTAFNYSLSYKNNLTDPSWTPLGGSVAGNGMIQTMTDGISQSHRFYRLTIQ